MKKVLIVAQSDAKSKAAEAMFAGKALFRRVYPGADKFSRNFDAVIIYLQDTNEINFIKDLLT
jgi:hypothetical protein